MVVYYCGDCVWQITMTTAWFLLLLIVFCQSVDSQSTTDDDRVCDGQNLEEMKRDILYRILDNQQQIFNRLGESSSTTGETVEMHSGDYNM